MIKTIITIISLLLITLGGIGMGKMAKDYINYKNINKNL